MNLESQKNQTEKPVDEKWFDRLHEAFFEDYEKLSGNKENRELEKESFINGVTENPTLDYPELLDFNMDQREEALLLLKEDILLDEETDPVVKKIYRTKINEIVASVRMLRAAKDGDDKKFSRYSSFIHGVPNPENTAYVIDAIKHKLAATDSNDPERQVVVQRLNKLLQNYKGEVDPDMVDRSVLPEKSGVKGFVQNSAEAVACMQEVLDELGVDNWEIVVDSKKGLTGFSVSQELKEINIPSDDAILARKLTKRKLAGLVEHELKTHIARRHNGERSKLKLLGLGLDRYVKGEEGVATYAEQQVTGATEFAGVQKYFAIAVAKGFDGQPRTFRETFEVMKDYYSITLKNDETINSRAINAAWNDCVRIFRGTTGTTPGAVFTKDLAYLGNRDIWQLVSKNSNVVQTFSIGKFDSTNSEHIAALVQLGILDEDLLSLNE